MQVSGIEDFDAGDRLQKEVKKNDLKVQKEETVKNTVTRGVSESGVILLRHCDRPFVCQQ